MCAFPRRKAHALYQRHRVQQEIRGKPLIRFGPSGYGCSLGPERPRACGPPKVMKIAFCPTTTLRGSVTPSPVSSLNPNNRSPMEAPPSPCHPEEPTCLREVKGAMNSTGHRGPDGCPMFAPAYVGRKSRAKPLKRFLVVSGYGCSLGAQPRDLQFYGPFGQMFFCFFDSVPGVDRSPVPHGGPEQNLVPSSRRPRTASGHRISSQPA